MKLPLDIDCPQKRALIDASENELFFSAASLSEILTRGLEREDYKPTRWPDTWAELGRCAVTHSHDRREGDLIECLARA